MPDEIFTEEFEVVGLKSSPNNADYRGLLKDLGNGMTKNFSGMMTKIKELPTIKIGDWVRLQYQDNPAPKGGNYHNIVKILDVGKAPEGSKIPAKEDKPLENDSVRSDDRSGSDRNKEIEQAVWWKEVGEGLRSGLIDRKTASGMKIAGAYFAQMSKVLGISFKQEKSQPPDETMPF